MKRLFLYNIFNLKAVIIIWPERFFCKIASSNLVAIVFFSSDSFCHLNVIYNQASWHL